jgi:small subunit ribosomal protein S7
MVAEKKITQKTEKAPVKTEIKPAKKVEKPLKAEKIEAPIEIKPKVEIKKIEKPQLAFNFKLFGKWDQQIVVVDPGLKRYITLKPILIPFSQGRTVGKQFWKSDKHIVERLILKLMITGHKGKKHYRTSGHNTGKYATITKLVKQTFEIIENKTKKNPLEVYVRAIENSAPYEGVTTIEYGGVRYPKAVDLSPQRRIDLSLRWMCQGAHHAKAGKGKSQSLPEALAKQIMLSAAADQTSNAVQKKFEMERSASASR